MENNLNLAVLIDGDNIPSAHVKEMMEEIAKYGNPTIKRSKATPICENSAYPSEEPNTFKNKGPAIIPVII